MFEIELTPEPLEGIRCFKNHQKARHRRYRSSERERAGAPGWHR